MRKSVLRLVSPRRRGPRLVSSVFPL